MSETIKGPTSKQEQTERLQAVLAAIEANPEHHIQHQWHCGTRHCFAGFAQLLALEMPVTTATDPGIHYLTVDGRDRYAPADALKWLGLSGERLFFVQTLDELRNEVDRIIADPNSLAP